MAIDPSISLGVKPVETPDWMSLAGKYQSILNAQTQQQLGQAQLPGAVAASATAQEQAKQQKRVSAAQQWDIDNAGKFVTPEGAIDYDAMSRAKALAGFAPEAQTMQGVTEANRSAAAAARQADALAKQQERIVAYQKWQADNGAKFVVPDPTNPTKTTVDYSAAQKAAAAAGFPLESAELGKTHLDLVGKEIANAQNNTELAKRVVGFGREAAGTYGTILEGVPPANRSTVVQSMAKTMNEHAPGSATIVFGLPDKDGIYKTPTDTNIKAMKMTSMTPAEQIGVDNAIRMTNSQIELNNIAKATATGQPGYLDPNARAQYAVTAAQHESTAQLLRDAQTAAADLSADRAVGGFIGDKASSWINQHLDDPRVGKIMAAKAYLESLPGGKPMSFGQGWQMMGGQFGTEAKKTEAVASEYRRLGQPASKPVKGTGMPAVEPVPTTSKGNPKPSSSGLPTVTSQEQYDKLSVGDKYLTADGHSHTKKAR